jgi:hypothetical protein
VDASVPRAPEEEGRSAYLATHEDDEPQAVSNASAPTLTPDELVRPRRGDARRGPRTSYQSCSEEVLVSDSRQDGTVDGRVRAARRET